MNIKELVTHRVSNQQLIKSSLKNADEVVAWFGAVQAQEYVHAKWALGLRLPKLKDVDVEDDFNSGKLLRTHVLRPTWHFVHAEDIRWLLQLTAQRVHSFNRFMYRKLELDQPIFNRCNKLIEKTLGGGYQCTREELNTEFNRKKIVAQGLRLSYIMMQAELEGIICSGARKGKQFTYALLEERVQGAKKTTNEEALSQLTRRYFASRGPATIHDFSTWSGLTATECKKGIAQVGAELMEITINNERYIFFDRTPNKLLFNQMHLIPIYDELVMGYKNRSAFMLLHRSSKIKPAFKFDSTIMHNGQFVGTWKRTIKTKSLELEYDFFKSPDKKAIGAFNKEIKRLEEFYDMPVRVLNGQH